MKNVTGIGFLVILLISINVQAQKVDKIYERAENLFYSELLEDALLDYQTVIQIQPGYRDAQYKAEICSLLTVYREKPMDQILSFDETFGQRDKFYKYWLGRIYVRKYMYEEAKRSFEEFIGGRGKKSKEILSETKDFIAEAEKRLNFFYNTDDYEIHQLQNPVNSEFGELTPAFFVEKDELIFASNRSTSGRNDEFSIFHAIKEDDNYTDIREITILGSFPREVANVEVVDEDGKLFLFDPRKGDLFYSESRNGQWVQPVEFDTKLKAAHIQSHFYINEHEDRIIFSTVTKGKREDLDLYQTFRDPESGKWSKPAPFNLVINSEFDEDSPFLTKDEKTLYFASNGHGSIGGLDIYKSELNPETLEWSEPVNLGFPINSPDDEVHFKMNPDGKSGYFSSNRLHTKGDFDIYLFWEIEKIKIEGRVFDLTANQSIENGMIRFTPSQYTDEHFRSDLGSKGKYSAEIIADETYLVEIIQDGKTLFTDEFEIHETGGLETTYLKDFLFQNGKAVAQTKVSQEKTRSSSSQVLNKPAESDQTKKQITVAQRSTPVAEKSPSESAKISSIKDLPKSYSKGKKAIIHNVYFDFGTSGLSPGSHVVLNELFDVMKNNPSLKVEIGGHTDNTGPKDANAWLSQRRAESVRNWLIKKGIASSRMVAKGYGESQPIASNDDEKDGRELNRRIEIFVIQN
jgi:outer membrane protein OmpA-like peptidoglycan-associated protein